MDNNFRYILFYILVISLSSCEKDINIKLDPSEPKVVIDATIENDRNPIVYLSKSLDYFSAITPEVLSDALPITVKACRSSVAAFRLIAMQTMT